VNVLESDIRKGGDVIRSRCSQDGFEIAIVLGSGLGCLADEIADPCVFPYEHFDFLPPTTVEGHAGRLVAGTLEGHRILVFQGRYHLYEGHSASRATLPIRLARELGCEKLLLTNAAGGINEVYRPGDFMFIDDHLNLLGDNPLRGATRNPFIDLSQLYERHLYDPLLSRLKSWDCRLHSGILAALPGPSYETPAEIRMLSRLGADAVSMSTVPEAIMGKYLGMDVAGVSMISNLAAGRSCRVLDHDDVLRTSRSKMDDFSTLVHALIDLWQRTDSP